MIRSIGAAAMLGFVAVVPAQPVAARRRGGYYWWQGGCYYRYPNGDFVRVRQDYC